MKQIEPLESPPTNPFILEKINELTEAVNVLLWRAFLGQMTHLTVDEETLEKYHGYLGIEGIPEDAPDFPAR